MTMRNAVSENFARVSTTGPFSVMEAFKTRMNCILKALGTEHDPRRTGEVAMKLLKVPETDTARISTSLLTDVAATALLRNRERYSIRVCQARLRPQRPLSTAHTTIQRNLFQDRTLYLLKAAPAYFRNC